MEDKIQSLKEDQWKSCI